MATSALAADIENVAPVPEDLSRYDWSGYYLGVQGGWGWADQELHDNARLNGEVDLNGAYFGPIVGWQRQWDWWVLGAEVDVNWSDIDGKDAIPRAPDRTWGEVEIFGSAGLKLGAAWDRVLLYGTAGIAGAETGTLQRQGLRTTDDHAASFGWMAGAGADFAVTPNVILGLQYKHYDLGEADYTMGFVPDRSGETDVDAVSGHVAFKLGGRQ